MKTFIYKSFIICTLIISGFFVFNYQDKHVDYQVIKGNELADMKFNSQYVTKLSNTVDQYDITVPDQFIKKAENNYLALYLEESSLAIAVENKINGYFWFSYDVNNECLTLDTYDAITCNAQSSKISEETWRYIKSGVSIMTYNDFNPGRRTLFDKNKKDEAEVSITIQDITNGFEATIDFTAAMVKFNLIVKIVDEDLLIEVPNESVLEYNPVLWDPQNPFRISLSNIMVYPYFGSTRAQENGYIVIPDGSGAITGLKEEPKYKVDYKAPVYGEDRGYKDPANIENIQFMIRPVKPLSRITLPIFGIIHDVGNTGLLVISESGANYATYNYQTRNFNNANYYQSYFEYNYRTEYKQYQSRDKESANQHILGYQRETNQFDITQRYVFLSHDEANYVGLAKNYREYLEERDLINQKNINNENYPTKIDIIGNEVKMGIFYEKDVTVTKYDEAVALVKRLQNDGYSNLDITFKAYNRSDAAYRFDIHRNLGGKDDFKEMIKFFEDENIDFDYYVDYVNSYEYNKYSANLMSRKAMSRFNMSYMYLISYINNSKYLPEFVDNDLETYNEFGISSLALDGLNNILYTHNERGDVKYSTENMAHVEKALKMINDENISLSVYNPDSYIYPYIDKYYDAPITSSELIFVDATIPLVQLVTSGNIEQYSPYLNFVSNESGTLLRLVEYGVNPAYVMTDADAYDLKYTNSSHIYISQYDSLKNRMSKYDSFLKTALDAISGHEMVNHQFLDLGIVLVEYSNGVKIIVNYTEQDYEYSDGTIIQAKGYGVL